MGKPQSDREDVRIVAESLTRFGAMTWEQYRDHVAVHRDDLGHSLNMPDRRHRSMGGDAARAFSRITKRQAEKDPDGDAIDLEKLNEAVRKAFVETFVVGGKPWDEQKWIDRMLNKATAEAKKEFEGLTHYLPCVVLYKGHPDMFAIGPVQFITKTKFFADYGEKLRSDHNENREKQRVKLDLMIAEGKYHANNRKSE
jgi:hypothetical protein